MKALHVQIIEGNLKRKRGGESGNVDNHLTLQGHLTESHDQWMCLCRGVDILVLLYRREKDIIT